MRILTIIIFTHLLINSSAFAQVSDKGFPSPNAAALGKYADYPVSYFTGVPAINIPLYTLKDGAATLPISLSYHASGIKVGEVASSVGLGWVLNAGGVITRTVKGAPDEGSKNDGDGPKGYYKDSGLFKFPKLDMVTNPSSLIRKFIDNNTDKRSVDGEPDIYAFNINGMVGKFVFDEKRNPTFLTQSDVRINVEYSGGEFQRWIITTPNGVQYIFGENNAKETNGIYGSTNADNNAPTSWYLTRIIYPNSTDTLQFGYISENDAYFSLASEFTTADDSATLATKVPDGGYVQYNVSGVRPSSIQSKNIIIYFDPFYGAYREDAHSRILSGMQVNNRNTNEVIDQVKFNYDYFTSTTDGSLELGTKDITDTKRLKLVSIQKGLQTSPIQLPPYTFEYYEDIKLPRRCSYDVDHWGYANDYGKHNNRFTPNTKTDLKITGLTVTPPSGGQNRYPRWPHTRAFSLKKITDPLGVSTTFEFEPNLTANNIYGDTIGGGMRIKNITTEDPISKQKQTRYFDYKGADGKSAGIIFRKPGYWTEVFNQFNPISSTQYSGESYVDMLTTTGVFCKYAQSPVPLQDYQGYSVGYRQVKEYVNSATENGYTLYTYRARNTPSYSTRLATYYSFLNFDGSLTGRWNTIPPEQLTLMSSGYFERLFPFVPVQTELYNGLLLDKEIFNGKNKLLQYTVYRYEDWYSEKSLMRGFIGQRLPYKGKNVYPFTYYKYRTGKVLLVDQQTTIIDTLTGKAAVTKTNYMYESPNHLQPTRQISTNSLGDTLENVMRYSFDFDNNAISDGVITEMKKQNILTPLRVEVWKNNNLIGCSSTAYAKNTVGSKTAIMPIKTYKLENTKVLSAADVGFNKAFNNNITSLNGSSSLMKLQSFYSYDNMGLIKQQGKINDIPASYIWDYNNTLPIAIASNAAPEDIAYTSFEADGAGNWTIGSNDRNTATSFTGNKSYDLSKGNITKTGLSSSKTYWLNYWAKTDASISVTNTAQTIQSSTKNGYTFWKKKITGTTSVTLSGSGLIDELRLYPDGAQMMNYTYTTGIGMRSKTDGENVTLYEYDEVNRLRTIRDADKNIVQQYCYNTAGKPISCDGTVFKNAPMSQVFTRYNCRPGYVAGTATYNIPQGKHTSLISQVDADNKAKADMNTNGQAYANTNATCTTTYVRLREENVTEDNPDFIIGDIVVRFYQDSACTVPKTVSNFFIQYTKGTNCTGSPPSSIKNYATCSGSYFYLVKDAVLYHKSASTVIKLPGVGDECSYVYYLTPGINYVKK